MKVEIIKDTKNPLLSRRQIKFVVTHDGMATPNKLDVAEHLAAKLSADMNLMVIEGYTTQFGSNISSGLCFVYDSSDAMNKAEPHNTLNAKKRVGGTREEAKDEAKEAAPVETETKAEEKTEAPVEEKAKEEAVTKEVAETTKETPVEAESKEEPKDKGETSETQSK